MDCIRIPTSLAGPRSKLSTYFGLPRASHSISMLENLYPALIQAPDQPFSNAVRLSHTVWEEYNV